MDFVVTQTLIGLSFGALLFLLASGLSLIFGVMKIVNIAHGSYYMLGAYVGLTVIMQTHSFFLGALIGALVIGVVGFLIEPFFLRRLPLMDSQMMLTVGFALIFRDLALMIWGGNPFGLPSPSFLKGAIHIYSVTLPVYRIFLIGMAALVAIFLWAFNEKTLIGAKLRAAVDDGEMAGGVGINVPLTWGLVFPMGAFLAAFGGVMG